MNNEVFTPFFETKRMFKNYVNYKKPLTFEEWIKLDSDSKVAVLYVQFFDQIFLAWNKYKTPYCTEEDAVSIVLQYLFKNVAKIEKEPSRYTPAYIYMVAYNCLIPICSRLVKKKNQKIYEVSNVIEIDGSETVDLFDLSDDDPVWNSFNQQEMWIAIESLNLSESMKKFVYSLCDSKQKTFYLSKNKLKIIEQLKKVLETYV